MCSAFVIEQCEGSTATEGSRRRRADSSRWSKTPSRLHAAGERLASVRHRTAWVGRDGIESDTCVGRTRPVDVAAEEWTHKRGVAHVFLSDTTRERCRKVSTASSIESEAKAGADAFERAPECLRARRARKAVASTVAHSPCSARDSGRTSCASTTSSDSRK